jgi:hypothetical protein
MTVTTSPYSRNEDRPSAERIPPAAAWAVIGLLMAAYTAAYAWSTPSADTADELMRAYEIRHAIAYPLEGPFLGNALHLGPLWWYLVALPLWIAPSWLAAALFVGLVCSLKFPLAYLCGRRLLDARFGLLWAAAMFVPGWTTLEPLVFLNPNAVAAAALLVLWLALICAEPRRGAPAFAALGLALAVAIHVHPTAAPVALLVVAVLWVRWRRERTLAVPLVAAAAGFALPLLPYVVSELRGGLADWPSASAYVAAQVVPANIVHAPAVIGDYLFAGPRVVAEYLLGWRRGVASLLAALMVLAATTGLAALGHPSDRRLLLRVAAALLLFAAWIACARPTTPFQFTWVLAPPVAAITALGLRSLARYGALRGWVWAAVAASIALNLWTLRAVAAVVDGGEGRLPSRVMDIKDRIPQTSFRDVWFPAYAHDRLGHLLCDAGEVALHGHLAYLADKDLGLDALFGCGDRSRLTLIASRAPAHAFGMTRRFWQALGAQPRCWVGSLGLTEHVTSLLDRPPIALADGATYMPRPLNRGAPAEMQLAFEAPAQAALLVTNVLDGYEPFRIVSASAGGEDVAPIAENDLSALYAPRRGAGPIHWTITVTTTNPQAIEAVAVGLAPPPDGRYTRACT